MIRCIVLNKGGGCKIKEKFLLLLMIAAFIAIIYSSSNIVGNLRDYHKSRVTYDDIKKIHVKEITESQTTDEADLSSNYKKMLELNSDYVGWVKIKDTRIDYPVVRGDDNSFYLSHNLYKDSDKAGCVFMDYQNSNQKMDKNIIIYGHNMKDKTMFNNLSKYLQQDFSDKHKLIYLEFLGVEYEYEVFSVYTTTGNHWMKLEFDNRDSFDEYLSEIKKKSVLPVKIQLDTLSNILTLATCTGQEKSDRVVVHAILKGRKG